MGPSGPPLGANAPPRMRRYLPAAGVVTCLVMLLPAVLVAAIAPRGGPLVMAVSGLSAVALSLALAFAVCATMKAWC